MKKLLHIISSPRGEASFSIKLGNAIIKKLQDQYPGSTVKEVNLGNQLYPHLEESHLNSFFTPAESRSPELQEAVRQSDNAVAEIQEADVIVIGAPMYNFHIPSALKAWLDHIIRAGITFKYGANGIEGLLNGKKVYIAEAMGGVYSEGPMRSNDFITPYLTSVLNFIGLTDVAVFRVEGTSVPGVQDTALEKGLSSIHLN